MNGYVSVSPDGDERPAKRVCPTPIVCRYTKSSAAYKFQVEAYKSKSRVSLASRFSKKDFQNLDANDTRDLDLYAST
jgi:hypothetical protein